MVKYGDSTAFPLIAGEEQQSITGQSKFSLNESEALIRRIDGKSGVAQH